MFYSIRSLSPRLRGTRAPDMPHHRVVRFIPTPVGNTCMATPMLRRLSVYPHACGEHNSGPKAFLAPYVLSPRLWGTRAAPSPGSVRTRFIPTPVGNTLPGVFLSYQTTVYPHACGEHSRNRRAACRISGLSPRLWGTPARALAASNPRRFIPTPVGNTENKPLRCRYPPVYPHACGEHAATPMAARASHGLSPRLWGTRRVPADGFGVRRFIPTPVGNTRWPMP